MGILFLGGGMEYKIIVKLQMSEGTVEGTIKLLVEEVNKYIAQGWKPIGGVAYAQESHLRWVMQAMIKEETQQTVPAKLNPLNAVSTNSNAARKRRRSN